MKGDPKFLEGLLFNYEQLPGKSYPCLLISSFCDKEGLSGLSSLLSDMIYFVVVFPHSLKNRELNRINRRILLVILFSVLITNLPCHVVTFQSSVHVS